MASQQQMVSASRYRGLSSSDVQSRREKFGANVLTPPAREPWWKQFLSKFDDPVIRILMIAAVLAIVAGISEGKYTEGVGIIIAVLLATTLAFVNEFKANKEFDILNKVNDDVPIKVIRDGHYLPVPRRDIVVGDFVLVEVGEELPCDGVVLESVSFQVEESSLTGESRPVGKYPEGKTPTGDTDETAYPRHRLLRGTFVVDGHAVMEVTAVGDSTEIGKTARSAEEETGEVTPLNAQLAKLSKVIGVVGFGIAAVTFAALVGRAVVSGHLVLSSQQWAVAALLGAGALIALIRVWLPIVFDGMELMGKEASPPEWLEKEGAWPWVKVILLGILVVGAGLGGGQVSGFLQGAPTTWLPQTVGQQFLEFFMIAVTIIVVAVPEGLAMSVTLSLAYSMRKMTATNNLVRRMHACETIGAATVICSDKTGTLTRNEMRVSEAIMPCVDRGLLADAEGGGGNGELIVESISVNTTANLSRSPGQSSAPLGNPTECALLLWLEQNNHDYILYRDSFETAYQWTFSTERKYMATLGTSKRTGQRRLYVKGAPEIVLSRCTNLLLPQGAVALDNSRKSDVEQQLKAYQARGMRTLGLAYHPDPKNHSGVDVEHVAEGMIWLGFVAIADPVRDEVPGAIEACRLAGIQVKVVTGDNAETAREVGRQIGLWQATDLDHQQHMTGPEFSSLSESEAREAVQGIKILSRARPMDKMRMVKLLQDGGEIVAVTGDGTNDAPALNYAHVGLAMGRTGTAVAKEASDIILLDDSFRSIVNAVMWGRSLYENIQRFILFQLTINVAALVIALLGPFIGVEIPLTVIQMLWINLIMDTFAALALATEPPHGNVMERKPRDSKSFIVSSAMARGIFGTAAIFIAVLIGLLLWVKRVDIVSAEYAYRLTVFYTVFVMLQFWNLFNARCLGHSFSAFSRITENKGLIAIAAGIFVGQIAIIQYGGEIFRTVPLSLKDWVVIIGATSLVLWVGEVKRLIARMSAHAKHAN
jgi:Ca2+-transporting ATPase